jgi:hypothetical protein
VSLTAKIPTRIWLQVVTVASILALLPGCILFPEEGFQGERERNLLPSAAITGGVYVDGGETENRIHFFWSGSDPDGVISFFEWAIDDTVSENAWHRTQDNDARIAFSATTPIIPGGEDEDVTHYSDWHIFYVRAVDNEFKRSTPDNRYFNSTTLAPTTRIVNPRMTTDVPRWATSIRISWEGEDFDATNTEQQPVAYEIKLIQPGTINPNKPEIVKAAFRDSLNIFVGNVSQANYPNEDIYNKARRAWTRIPGNQTSQWLRQMDPGGGKYAFAIRAIDEAGAREQRFDRGLNWVVFSVGNTPVKVRMREPMFGDENFNAGAWGQFWDVTAPPNQPIHFSWTGDASGAGSEPGASAWAWDIADPTNPDIHSINGIRGWTGWSMSHRSQVITFPPSTGEDQVHYFYMKMRDISDEAATETKCIVRVTIADFQFSKKFLIVDDLRVGPTPCSGTNPTDGITDDWRLRKEGGQYYGVLSGVGAYLGENESPGYEHAYGEVGETNSIKLPDNFLEVLGEYQTVIWDFGNGQDREKCGLRKCAVETRSLLQYVSMGGNLLAYGMFGPTTSILELSEGTTVATCPDPYSSTSLWNNSSFLWQQLRLRGCIDKAHSTSDYSRSLIGADAENPLYPDMAIDPNLWSCAGNYRGIIRYEYLAPEFEESEVIPWYDLEEGLDILYRTKVGQPGSWQDNKPLAYRTYMTAADSLAQHERGRVVSFGVHPYYFYADAVEEAMSLAIDWLVTGKEYSGSD